MATRRPQPILLDMPEHVLRSIIENVGGYEERLRLRKVSHTFRFLVDTQPIHFDSVALSISIYEISLTVSTPKNDLSISFSPYFFESQIEKERNWLEKKCYPVRSTYFQRAVQDLSIFFANPRLKIDKFHVVGVTKNSNDVLNEIFFGGNSNFWKNSKFPPRPPLTVQSLTLDFHNGLPSFKFLKFLISKHLKSIEISSWLNIVSRSWQVLKTFPKISKKLELPHLEYYIPIEKMTIFDDLYLRNRVKLAEFKEILEHFLHSSSIQRYRSRCSRQSITSLKPLVETADLKLEANNKFRREFKNLKNPAASFSLSIYWPDFTFERF